MLQPTPTLTDQVAGQLARAIADGAYAVGAKLPTGRALAQQYGVSAAVIREATERLRAQGLVQSRQGSGCTVVARTPAGGFQVPAGGLDRAHLARVYELRMELEGGAAALAARRRGAADLDRMRQALQALQREPIEPEQGVVHDVGFHVAIATATANPYYLQLLQYLNLQLRQAVETARANTRRQGDPVHAVHEEHLAIYRAIERGEPGRRARRRSTICWARRRACSST